MTQPIGNEEQMEQIRQAMRTAQSVGQGGDAKEGVYIDFTSSMGTKYQGWVVFKRPTMTDFMRMGGIKSEIFRRAGVKDLTLIDDSIALMAHVMSVLEVVLVKRPEWLLKIQEVQEPDVLYHINGKFNDWESAFRQDFRGEPTDDTEDSAGA